MFRKLFHHLSRPQPADTGNPKSRSLYCPVPLTLAMVQERAAQQHKQKNSRKLQLVRLHSAFATQLDQLAQTTTDLASTCAALPTFPAAAPLPSLFAPLYSVSQCGTRAYLKRSELDLLSSCSALLEELRLQLCLSPEDFNRLIMPLLQALARNVSVVPASQGHHDVQNGGLLRHSLLCALCAVSTAAHSEAFGTLTAERGELPAASPESATLALCALALCHDLGKIVTDLKIYADDGTLFEPGKQSLSEFLYTRNSTFAHVDFVRGRGIKHRLCEEDDLKILSKRVLSALPEPLFTLVCSLMVQDDPFTRMCRRLINDADREAVKAVRTEVKEYLDLPSFILSEIAAQLAHLEFTGCDLENGVILTTKGLFFFTKSPLLYRLGRQYEQLFSQIETAEGKNPTLQLITNLRTTGLLLCPEVFRMKQWCKFFIGSDICFARGIFIAWPPAWYPGLETVSSVMLGADAGELEELRQHLEQKYGADPAIELIIIPRTAYALSPDPLPYLDVEKLSLTEHGASGRAARIPARPWSSPLLSDLKEPNSLKLENSKSAKPCRDPGSTANSCNCADPGADPGINACSCVPLADSPGCDNLKPQLKDWLACGRRHFLPSCEPVAISRLLQGDEGEPKPASLAANEEALVDQGTALSLMCAALLRREMLQRPHREEDPLLSALCSLCTSQAIRGIKPPSRQRRTALRKQGSIAAKKSSPEKNGVMQPQSSDCNALQASPGGCDSYHAAVSRTDSGKLTAAVPAEPAQAAPPAVDAAGEIQTPKAG